jgi:hypothetical protein
VLPQTAGDADQRVHGKAAIGRLAARWKGTDARSAEVCCSAVRRWDESGPAPAHPMSHATVPPCRKPIRRVAPASTTVATPAPREGWEPPTAGRCAGRRALRAEPEGSVSKPNVRAKKAAVLPLSGKPPGSAPTRSKTQLDKGAKGRTAMRKIALDLGARETTYCEVQDGKVVDRGTVREIASLVAVLGPERPPATVAFEAGRQAWFVHDLLVGWHNEVIVVDTTRVKQLGVGQQARPTHDSCARRCHSGSWRRTLSGCVTP